MDESNIEHYPSEKVKILNLDQTSAWVAYLSLWLDFSKPQTTVAFQKFSKLDLFTATAINPFLQPQNTKHVICFLNICVSNHLFEILPTQQNQNNPMILWMPITIRIIGSTEHPNVSPGFLNYYESEVPKNPTKLQREVFQNAFTSSAGKGALFKRYVPGLPESRCLVLPKDILYTKSSSVDGQVISLLPFYHFPPQQWIITQAYEWSKHPGGTLLPWREEE